MKAFEQYFPGVLFIMLYGVVFKTFELVGEILKRTIQMKAFSEQYFLLVLFI